LAGRTNVLEDKHIPSTISNFLHGVNVIFALLGCYTALIDSWLPMFWDNLVFKQSEKNLFFWDCLTLEYGTDRLS
jgi:hypothetical protein